MRSLIVLGTGGLAREVAMVANLINIREQLWDCIRFVSAVAEDIGRDLGYGVVAGDDNWLLSGEFCADLLIGIGYPQLRARAVAPYLEQRARFEFPNLVHPSATMDRSRVHLGEGNVITAGCALTCDIKVADFNLFNLNGTVGHDATVGSYNVFNPSVNISGNVSVADRVLVGTGAQILENLSIGSDATVGAGAVVRADVASGQTVVGVPAKPLTR